MTLEQLRTKATASELTLIDAVIKCAELEAAAAVRAKLSDFINNNSPPVARDSFLAEELRRWIGDLAKSLN